jgi:hypothetical protein
MKLRSLLTGAALVASFGASAQNWVADTITMGGGYAKDVYYSMSTGVVKEDSANRWDLAFSAIPVTYARSNPHYGVGAWINSAVSTTGVTTKLYSLHRRASTTFNTINGSDTGAALTNPLVNSDTSYGYGAFNMNNNGTIYNYGWGSYNPTSHNIIGDSVYIAVRGRVAYKIWIEEYISLPPTTWKFHVQKLDNSSPAQIVTINATNNFANRVLAYYSFANGVIDREPASNTWDLNFTRYTTYVDLGQGPGYNPTPGVLINPYIKVAKAWRTNADTTHYQNYPFSYKLNAIGREWKTGGLNSTFTAFTLDTVNYFVKAIDNKYYQLEFTYATPASAGGKVAFRKRMIAPTGINTVNNSISNYYAAPNPANNDLTLMIDTKERTDGAMLALTDISGRIISRQTVNVAKGINSFRLNTANIPAGMYLISVKGSNLQLAHKISVAH